MRKIAIALAAFAALGIALPVTTGSAQAQDTKVVVKKKVEAPEKKVIIKKHRPAHKKVIIKKKEGM